MVRSVPNCELLASRCRCSVSGAAGAGAEAVARPVALSVRKTQLVTTNRNFTRGTANPLRAVQHPLAQHLPAPQQHHPPMIFLFDDRGLRNQPHKVHSTKT